MAAWVLPTVVWSAARAGRGPGGTPLPGVALALTLAVILTLSAPAIWARYRNGSQGFRLVVLALALVVPALAFYPTVFARRLAGEVATSSRRATRRRRSTSAPPSTRCSRRASGEIDALPGLAALGLGGRPPGPVGRGQRSRVPGLAGHGAGALSGHVVGGGVWAATARLLSRFAFNLPEDLSARLAVRRSRAAAGRWPRKWRRSSPTSAASTTPGARSAAAARHASSARLSCTRCSTTRTCRSPPRARPTWSCCSPAIAARGPDAPGDDVQYAVYGWSRTPLYSSHETAWPLDDAVFALVEQSRDPVWARLRRNDEPFDVFLMNDRGGIYALGFPAVSALGHLVNLAELTTLGAAAFLGVAAIAGLFGLAARRFVLGASTAARGARQLLPQAVSGLRRRRGRAGGAAGRGGPQLRRQRDASGVEREALRTSAAASRVVVGPDRAAGRAAGIGARRQPDGVGAPPDRSRTPTSSPARALQATSERNLFASGLLPSRTPRRRLPRAGAAARGRRPWRASGSATSSTWSPPRRSGSAAPRR